jgi:hypothetical protein
MRHRNLFKRQHSSFLYLIHVLILIVHFSLFVCISQGQDLETTPGDLFFKELPERWDKGFPLGNGMVGALVWEKDNHLRFSLDRADLWDLWEVSELRELTFDWVHQKVMKSEYGPVQELGDAPYDKIPYPTKIQAAGLNFNTENFGSIEDARLYLKSKEQQRWEKRMNELPDFSIDSETGLLVAPGEPLLSSHRHFSHLMAIHPLGLMDPSQGDEQREIIETSLEHLEEIGSGAWVGYSFSWLANLYARTGNGEKVEEASQIFASNFVSPNSFHLNGDQKGGDYSNFTYRPFTLEGNFAFAAGLQEMLLQSHGDTIEIFPAIPNDWSDVRFENLRAQGAFIVSESKMDGQVEEVQIHSEKRGNLKLQNALAYGSERVLMKDSQEDRYRAVNTYQWIENTLSINLSQKEDIKL